MWITRPVIVDILDHGSSHIERFCEWFLTRICLFLEVLSKGAWPLISRVKDPKLHRLAQALPDTVLSARADSTTKKYGYAFQRWKDWANSFGEIPSFPVEPEHLCLYLQHLKESTGSSTAAKEAVNATAWAHQMAGVESVSVHPLVKATVAGISRALARPVQKKEPVSAEMLLRMVEAMPSQPTLSDVRVVAVCLLAFAGFLRIDEVLNLRCSDIVWSREHMEVGIRRSKTDQFRQGNKVLIAKSGLPTCPVAMMERYFKLAGLDNRSEGKLFRGISKSAKGEKLRSSGGISTPGCGSLGVGADKGVGLRSSQVWPS